MVKKEVKKQVKEVKKDFELDIITLLKKGLNPSKIAVHLNISLPNLSYYLSSLKEQNVIKKVGYGTWQVIPSGEVKILSHKGSLQVKDVRGHAFIWKIKQNKKFNWKELLDIKEVKNKLKKKISFIIESESDDDSIKSYLKRWIKDNFKFTEEEIKIEEIKDEEEKK